MIAELERLGFTGDVYSPEYRESQSDTFDYTQQVEWELQGLQRADLIVFYVPRQGFENNSELDAAILDSATVNDVIAAIKEHTQLGLTTNVEFGRWIDSGKVLLGYPAEAQQVRYLRWLQKEVTGKDVVYASIPEMAGAVFQRSAQGVHREGGEAALPIAAWKVPGVQAWRDQLVAQGHEILGGTLKFQIPNFLGILHPSVSIPAEGRSKDNEVVIFRPDMTHVLLYRGSEFLMVREFRSATGYVYELPGGSSRSAPASLRVAMDEVYEEAGMAIAAGRFRPIAINRANQTLCGHNVHLYAVELTVEEMERAAALSRQKVEFGLGETEEGTERTTLHVVSLADLQEGVVTTDWVNLGMIYQVLK